MSQSLSTGQRGLEQRAKSWLPMTTVTSQPPQRASVLSLESSREVPAAWREWLCFSDTMEFLLSQCYWEIIYTHQCMSLRQTAWWFGLNIPWSDCHNRFSQHPSSCMESIFSLWWEFLGYICFYLSFFSLSVVSVLQPHGLYNPPVSSVHGISQVRILKWVSLPYSRGISQPRDLTRVSCKSPALQTYSLLLNYQGSPC